MMSSELRERLDTLIDTTAGINHRPSIRLAINIVTEAINALEAAEQQIAALSDQLYRGGTALEMAKRVQSAEQQAERLAGAIEDTLRLIREFRVWIEDEYIDCVDAEDPLIKEVARLGLYGQAESTLATYRQSKEDTNGV